jgi:hypothetical protein
MLLAEACPSASLIVRDAATLEVMAGALPFHVLASDASGK